MEVQFRLVPSRNLLTSNALVVFTGVGALVNLNVVIKRPLAQIIPNYPAFWNTSHAPRDIGRTSRPTFFTRVPAEAV